MESFIDLLKNKRVDVKSLISHEIGIEDSKDAYNMILSKTENFSAILIKYDETHNFKKDIILNDFKPKVNQPNIGLVGAGSLLNLLSYP